MHLRLGACALAFCWGLGAGKNYPSTLHAKSSILAWGRHGILFTFNTTVLGSKTFQPKSTLWEKMEGLGGITVKRKKNQQNIALVSRGKKKKRLLCLDMPK